MYSSYCIPAPNRSESCLAPLLSSVPFVTFAFPALVHVHASVVLDPVHRATLLAQVGVNQGIPLLPTPNPH